jgi:hypothetical protein
MFVSTMSLVAALACAVAVAALGAARPSSGAGGETRHVVRPGDTLWAIALEHSDGDPRAAIWRIKERNGLRRSALAPGQVLYIPP